MHGSEAQRDLSCTKIMDFKLELWSKLNTKNVTILIHTDMFNDFFLKKLLSDIHRIIKINHSRFKSSVLRFIYCIVLQHLFLNHYVCQTGHLSDACICHLYIRIVQEPSFMF